MRPTRNANDAFAVLRNHAATSHEQSAASVIGCFKCPSVGQAQAAHVHGAPIETLSRRESVQDAHASSYPSKAENLLVRNELVRSFGASHGFEAVYSGEAALPDGRLLSEIVARKEHEAGSHSDMQG